MIDIIEVNGNLETRALALQISGIASSSHTRRKKEMKV